MTRPRFPRNGSGANRDPVPDGWPGDDPTMEDDVALLGGRRHGRHDRRRGARRGVGAHRGQRPDAPGDGAERASDDADRFGGGDVDHDPGHDLGEEREVGRMLGRIVEQDLGRDDMLEQDDDMHDIPGPGGAAADAHPDDDRDDAVAGRVPAGRVLVVMVGALLLAMLVNADALVERAERRPPGRDRDRALAIWEPVQDVSHALQLHRIRDLADWAAGDDGEDAGPLGSRTEARRAPGSGGSTSPTTAATAGEGGDATGDGGGGGDGDAPASDESGAGRAPELRQPSEDDPLRLWVGGDSIGQELAPALAASTEETGLVDAAVHVEGASGLARPDFFDWPRTLTAEAEDADTEVVVFAAGVNDGQGLVLDDGTAVPEVTDPRWSREYRRRVGELMDRLQRDDRLVLWVLLPPMAEPGYAARQDAVREAVTAEAGERPWVLTIDAATSVAGPDGAYAAELPGPDGQPVAIRRSDGIHLTQAGGDRLAAQVRDVIAAHVDLG